MNQVDTYLEEGCGRCSYYRTPDCKVHTWKEIIIQLRKILLSCGLKEEYKWSQPCYTYEGSNVLIATAFKDYAALAFFKGSLLKDPNNILVAPGEHSQASRLAKFTDIEQVENLDDVLRAYIFEAIDLEKTGKQLEFKKDPEPIPAELQAKFDQMPELKTAFEALTPGRQRGYIIHFTQPKQSKTRESRIEKCVEKILRGEGFHDAYRMNRK